MTTRTPLMAGNWKMNLNHSEHSPQRRQTLRLALRGLRTTDARSRSPLVPFHDLRCVRRWFEHDS
ncbi:hypothetical protein [Streptomyces sp. DHE17-7]|uniref:hypothetical protein n=1 Tax=Streptomyces sp. DHE17-7 TaxID=2759949 RepID=UPI0022EA425E|nr:hypothetical protein [Streptomyces sp. DHE17-7]